MLTTEYKTVFEKFLFPSAFLFLLAAVIMAISLFSGFDGSAAIALILSVAIFVLSVSLMFGFSTCYEFSAEDRRVYFRLSWFSFSWRYCAAEADDVTAFSVTGIRNRARVHVWWTYKIVMILKSGMVMSVSPSTDKSVHSMNRLAEKLATLMGCEFFSGQGEKTIHVAIAGERPILEYHEWRMSDVVAEFWPDIACSLILFAVILCFIVAAVVMLSQTLR